MGKRGGSSGYSSMGRIFEQRGDPMVTQREAIRDYGRNPETEDPEYDFDHRFHKTGSSFGKPRQAVERVEHRDPVPVKQEDDSARRRANIMLVMRRKQREHANGLNRVAEAQRGFHPCPGCTRAVCIARRTCEVLVKGER